jgi:hypothetical protein
MVATTLNGVATSTVAAGGERRDRPGAGDDAGGHGSTDQATALPDP